MEDLSICNLNFGYSENNIIFENVALKAVKGDRICILGENGTGKSTFLKILSNVIKCEFDFNFFEKKDTQVKDEIKQIAYIADKPFLYSELTGYENISFILSVFGEKKETYIPKVMNLCEKFNIRLDLNTKIKNYSLGMQHKLFLAAILSRDTRLILLDEPITALDMESQEVAVDELIKRSEEGAILIFSSHIEKVQNDVSNKFYEIKEKKINFIER